MKNENLAFLYLLICKFKEFKFVKIGRTTDLYKRIHNIKTGCPHKITRVLIMISEFEEEVIGWEKLLHRLLSDSTLNGEWYLCDDLFMYNFNTLIDAINTSSILNDNFEFLEAVSIEEAEILMHSHNIKFSLIEVPVKKSINIIERNITISRLKEIINDDE